MLPTRNNTRPALHQCRVPLLEHQPEGFEGSTSAPVDSKLAVDSGSRRSRLRLTTGKNLESGVRRLLRGVGYKQDSRQVKRAYKYLSDLLDLWNASVVVKNSNL